MDHFFSYIIPINLVIIFLTFIFFIIGVIKLNSNPEIAKKFLIAAGISFLIAGGICGVMINSLGAALKH